MSLACERQATERLSRDVGYDPSFVQALARVHPRRRRGGRCCEPVVYPDVEREHAIRLAEAVRALGDPIRLQLVDVLRKHAGKVCVCGLMPLFDVSQPTLSHHLKKLRGAGLVDVERQGPCAYYYVPPAALDALAGWLR